MRILLHTRFAPEVGGIQTVSWLLAHAWARAGIEVAVATESSGGLRHPLPFKVHSRPTFRCWLDLMRRATVFVQMNVSLRTWWVRCCVPRRFVAVHHGRYVRSLEERRDWREKLKLRVAAGADANIAVSKFVAREIGVPCAIIENPFEDGLFCETPGEARARELAFVGRLVSDKGCDLLIRALSRLASQGLFPQLTVIGDGPERPRLEALARTCGVNATISFLGAQEPATVARLLCQHQILVVPSLWNEPYGVVALEGAACGCVVLGSNGGGLPEAIGPTGETFDRGNEMDLAAKLALLLSDLDGRAKYRRAAAEHLEFHRPVKVAQRYLEVFRGGGTAASQAS